MLSKEKMMYYLFYGKGCYPLGGIKDLQGCFTSLELAIEFCEGLEFDKDFEWAHIANENLEVVRIFSHWLVSGKDVWSGKSEDDGRVEWGWINGGLEKERLYKRRCELVDK